MQDLAPSKSALFFLYMLQQDCLTTSCTLPSLAASPFFAGRLLLFCRAHDEPVVVTRGAVLVIFQDRSFSMHVPDSSTDDWVTLARTERQIERERDRQSGRQEGGHSKEERGPLLKERKRLGGRHDALPYFV